MSPFGGIEEAKKREMDTTNHEHVRFMMDQEAQTAETLRVMEDFSILNHQMIGLNFDIETTLRTKAEAYRVRTFLKRNILEAYIEHEEHIKHGGTDGLSAFVPLWERQVGEAEQDIATINARFEQQINDLFELRRQQGEMLREIEGMHFGQLENERVTEGNVYVSPRFGRIPPKTRRPRFPAA